MHADFSGIIGFLAGISEDPRPMYTCQADGITSSPVVLWVNATAPWMEPGTDVADDEPMGAIIGQ